MLIKNIYTFVTAIYHTFPLIKQPNLVLETCCIALLQGDACLRCVTALPPQTLFPTIVRLSLFFFVLLSA